MNKNKIINTQEEARQFASEVIELEKAEELK